MNIPKEAQQQGGVSQSQIVYLCHSCQSYGQGNKMINHMKKCDGSGLKNYWSKKRSKFIETIVNNLPQIF